MLICALCIASSTLYSQNQNGLAFRYNRVNYITPRENYGLQPQDYNWKGIFRESDFRALEIAWFHYLKGDHTSVSVPVKFGVGTIPNSIGEKNNRILFTTADALIQHQLFQTGKYLLNPYIHYGIGGLYNFEANQTDLNLPIGLGVNFRMSENAFLTAQTQNRLASRKHTGWHHAIGVLFNFGGMAAPKVSDRDGDGIDDMSDVCPDAPGPAALMGCPDRDSDGVADKDDKCPDVLGLPALMGCPDRDGDGITDADDKCPNDKGTASFMGCPDTDGDGIVDSEDNCPKEKGTPAFKGCPDTDGDGIADKDDKCPKEKGLAANNGCPVMDKDGDGVADKDDACPDKKGDAAHRGCPDTDGDGVYDNDDRCVTKPGPASNKGCPELKKEDKAKLQNVVKNVQFETGKATLLARSSAILDEVVALLNQYPEYSLNISGHTDNVGDAAKNKTLSEQRAKACYDYIVSKGIAASRMTHAGYGDTKPVADNKTKAGRDTNRRVDFDLFVK